MRSLRRFALLVPLLSVFACGHRDGGETRAKAAAEVVGNPQEALPSLRVSELLAPGAELKPSARASALSGARVRLVGFIAELEVPLEDALYLVPQPIHCDEAGGGSADLPPEAVLVALPSHMRQRPEHLSFAVEAVGVLEVGNHSDAQGRVANFHLRLQAPDVQKAL